MEQKPLHSAYSASPVLQVVAPLVLTFLVLVLAAAIALWTGASGALVIWAMLGSVGLMGATTALLQGGLYGLAGLCPPIYVQVRVSAYSLPLQTIVRSLWQPWKASNCLAPPHCCCRAGLYGLAVQCPPIYVAGMHLSKLCLGQSVLIVSTSLEQDIDATQREAPFTAASTLETLRES